MDVWPDASFFCLIEDKIEIIFQYGTLGYYYMTVHRRDYSTFLWEATERFDPLQINCKLHTQKKKKRSSVGKIKRNKNDDLEEE